MNKSRSRVRCHRQHLTLSLPLMFAPAVACRRIASTSPVLAAASTCSAMVPMDAAPWERMRERRRQNVTVRESLLLRILKACVSEFLRKRIHHLHPHKGTILFVDKELMKILSRGEASMKGTINRNFPQSLLSFPTCRLGKHRSQE